MTTEVLERPEVGDHAAQTEKYAAGMIVLNEEQFIGDWLRVHYGMFDHIIIVEGADIHFPSGSVSKNGLSLDRTAEIIRSFPDPEGKIKFIQHGWTAPHLGDVDLNDRSREGYREGEGKCILRDRYAQVLNEMQFEGILIQCDADEFYPSEIQGDLKNVVSQVTEEFSRRRVEVSYWTDEGYVNCVDSHSPVAKAALTRGVEATQDQINENVPPGLYVDGDPTLPVKIETEFPPGKIHAFQFPTIHLWHDMQSVIVGGYFDTDHTRVFRWKVGSRYEYSGRKSHNWPTSPEGKPLLKHGSHQRTRTFDVIPIDGVEAAETVDQLKGVAHSSPYCLHLGFTRTGDDLRDRIEYYKRRGEEISRPDTIRDREAWYGGKDDLSNRGLHVFPWMGHNPLGIDA